MLIRAVLLSVALCCLFPADAFAVEEFSTRGQVRFISGWFTWDDAKWDTAQPTLALPASLMPPNCPTSIVIYIHGFQNDAEGATSNFNQAESILRAGGFAGPVYGFSWDSDPGVTKFDIARESANLNGKVLAQLTNDIKRSCPGIRVNIITHSLGARVALQAMKCGGCADTVQMLAPAVDNEVLEADEEFGSSTVSVRAGRLKVWYNDDDDILGGTYGIEEGDSALGSGGSEHGARCLRVSAAQCDAEPKLKAGAGPNGKSRNPDATGTDAEDDHSGYIWSMTLMRCLIRRFRL